MWSDIAAIYRASLKRKDVNWFTTWIARPPAAVVVYALRNTRITPNQVTFMATVVAAAAGAVLVAWPGWLGLGVAIALYELSFVLDCADGMLARLRLRALWWVVAYPVAWIAFTMLRGAADGWYPYPFLEPAGPHGIGGVVAYIVGLAAAMIVLALLATLRTRTKRLA